MTDNKIFKCHIDVTRYMLRESKPRTTIDFIVSTFRRNMEHFFGRAENQLADCTGMELVVEVVEDGIGDE